MVAGPSNPRSGTVFPVLRRPSTTIAPSRDYATADGTSRCSITAIRSRAPASTVVDLLHSYSNPSPQVDAVLDRLEAPIEPSEPISGPSWRAFNGWGSPPTHAEFVTPRLLNQRLSAEQREAIVMAYAGGTPQKLLAAQYGISDRSVKRLIANARRSGMRLRTRAI
ncbi:sigma factor-like helix-turn-helix DNA-binding protein [Glycomyces salinus]|uniref:sigma factor-like helix-turn-helix DNA-binding protein n=1 Tax=Glycomyces salinus TaxID=980294 RepID=UPI0035563572